VFRSPPHREECFELTELETTTNYPLFCRLCRLLMNHMDRISIPSGTPKAVEALKSILAKNEKSIILSVHYELC
jgi:hypothetical protein